MQALEELTPQPRRRHKKASTRQRDSQRSKVYTAEDQAFGRESNDRAIKLITEKEVTYWVNYIVASKWWHTRVREDGWRASQPRVTFATRGGGANAHANGMLRFCPDARRRWIVLHELAHHATGTNVSGHGWEFCEAYLKLVRKWLGADHEARLKAKFKEHKVRYRKPRTRTLTPEQRAAAAERLAAARASRQVETGQFALRSKKTMQMPWWCQSVDKRYGVRFTTNQTRRQVWKTREAAQRWVDLNPDLEIVDLSDLSTQ